MQVLCIKTPTYVQNNLNPKDLINQGKIYNVIDEHIDKEGKYFKLQEKSISIVYLQSLFIPLSNIEGETYAKRKDVVVEI